MSIKSTLYSIRANAVCVGLALLPLTGTADEFQLPVEDRASAWFAPTLVTSNRPMCAAALDAERTTFFEPENEQPDIPG
jgi:hypothetical protein